MSYKDYDWNDEHRQARREDYSEVLFQRDLAKGEPYAVKENQRRIEEKRRKDAESEAMGRVIAKSAGILILALIVVGTYYAWFPIVYFRATDGFRLIAFISLIAAAILPAVGSFADNVNRSSIWYKICLAFAALIDLLAVLVIVRTITPLNPKTFSNVPLIPVLIISIIADVGFLLVSRSYKARNIILWVSPVLYILTFGLVHILGY